MVLNQTSMHSTALALDFLLHADVGLAHQYPVFVRLSIFSPNCRRGIVRCSFILTSNSMCIYFFMSFNCKKMHSGRIQYAFFFLRHWHTWHTRLSWLSSVRDSISLQFNFGKGYYFALRVKQQTFDKARFFFK